MNSAVGIDAGCTVLIPALQEVLSKVFKTFTKGDCKLPIAAFQHRKIGRVFPVITLILFVAA